MLLLMLLLACTRPRPEPAPAPTSTLTSMPTPPPPSSGSTTTTGATERLELLEGAPQTFRAYRLTARDVLYAHVGQGANVSLCKVTIEKGGERIEVAIDRESSKPMAMKEALGLQVGLDSVDAYGKPPRAFVVVR